MGVIIFSVHPTVSECLEYCMPFDNKDLEAFGENTVHRRYSRLRSRYPDCEIFGSIRTVWPYLFLVLGMVLNEF